MFGFEQNAFRLVKRSFSHRLGIFTVYHRMECRVPNADRASFYFIISWRFYGDSPTRMDQFPYHQLMKCNLGKYYEICKYMRDTTIADGRE